MKTFSLVEIVTQHSRRFAQMITLSARFLASCLVSMVLVRHDDIDLPETRRRAAMAHGVDLRGLALAVIGQTILLPIRARRDPIARLPEIGRASLICHARKHAALLAALDFPERIAAEL